MEKLIAFDLYRVNEHGGHTMAFRKPVVGDEVYLAADVEALRPLLEEIAAYEPGTFWGLTDEIKINNAAKKALALMESGR